ncbi:MAG: hypothetical protein JST10_08940 [Bacteroidetes bacterium]|nr:hypothetical protein [Bacteroidota bacterium]
MLIIDRSTSQSRFLVTQSEVNDSLATSLNLFNRATNKEYTFELPEDTSPYPDRFNEYIFDNAVFAELPQGLYSFVITDDQNSIKERGLLQVQNDSTPYSVDDVFVSIESQDQPIVAYEK